MLASKPDPLSIKNPVTLIRSRIKEKRLFEARFLYRQLGDAIGEREKVALEHELAGLIQQVDNLQQQARILLAEGQREKAARLYREMEAIAVDVPGLMEDKRALEGAAALAAKIASRAVEPEPPPITPTVAPPVEDGQDDTLPTPPAQGKKRAGRLWLAAGLVSLVLLLLLLFWRGGTKDPAPVVPPVPPAHNILIRPLESGAPPATAHPSPILAEQPPVQKAEPEQPPPPAEQPAASTRPLTLGTLQIQESGKK
jgi:hypothetical protein